MRGDDALISAGELESLLNVGASDVVIIETSWSTLDEAADYRRGHIPGAIHLDTDDLEDGYPRWLLRPLDQLHAVIGRHGIAPHTTVFVYSKRAEAAARLWWVLRYAGVADVRLVDGGLTAWINAGFPSETAVSRPCAAAFSTSVHSELLATTDDVLGCIGNAQTWLADTRSAAEYAGETSGYQYLDRKGRLPHSIHVGDASDA